MLSCPLKLPASQLCINSLPRTVVPNFSCMIEQSMNSSSCTYHVKNISWSSGLSCRAVNEDLNIHQKPHVVESWEGIKSDLLEEPNLTEDVLIDSLQCVPDKVEDKDEKGMQRAKKVGHGNKGRVPWNKGRKHSEETIERIRRGTKDALKDPKVRKKMSEAPRVLSNRTKVKIRASLTKLWEKRLKWKRSREKFLQSWAESIAEAAKIGGIDQQELEWDSYEKIERELALKQILQEAVKVKAKEMARIRAERAAQVKAEKMARLAQKRREMEEKAKLRGESIRRRTKKSKEEKEKLAETQEEKLKERLMKIRKKKSAIPKVSNQHQRSWENLDLDFAKQERLQTNASLADQIRFAKNKRAKQLLDKL